MRTLTDTERFAIARIKEAIRQIIHAHEALNAANDARVSFDLGGCHGLLHSAIVKLGGDPFAESPQPQPQNHNTQ